MINPKLFRNDFGKVSASLTRRGELLSNLENIKKLDQRCVELENILSHHNCLRNRQNAQIKASITEIDRYINKLLSMKDDSLKAETANYSIANTTQELPGFLISKLRDVLIEDKTLSPILLEALNPDLSKRLFSNDLAGKVVPSSTFSIQANSFREALDEVIKQLRKYRNRFIDKEGKLGKTEIEKIERQLRNKEEEFASLLHMIPNMVDDALPEKNFEVVFNCNTSIPAAESWIKPHWEVAEGLKLVDFSTQISGSRFVTYTGWGQKIMQALISFTLDFHEAKGFVRKQLPVIVSQESLFCTSQLPKFKKDLFELYTNQFLSPTGEVQLVNLYREKLLPSLKEAIKVCANTNCFRKEAGSHGKDTRGLIRLHQFSKTEMVVICKASESQEWLERLCKQAEGILIALKIPYRRILLPVNDLPFSSFITFDLEVWFPHQGVYREISSISNTLDFQARRGKIRYRNESGKSEFPHILNGSGVAIDRLFACILEQYQTKEGWLELPEELVKYLGVSVIKR